MGTSDSLKFSDSKQTNDSSFTTLNPQYPSSLSLTFTQPLRRDSRIDAGRHSLLVARKNHALSAEQLRQKAIERVTLAIQYYWELVYAWQNLDAQNEAVHLATEQYTATAGRRSRECCRAHRGSRRRDAGCHIPANPGCRAADADHG